jgi:hypothetical protein
MLSILWIVNIYFKILSLFFFENLSLAILLKRNIMSGLVRLQSKIQEKQIDWKSKSDYRALSCGCISTQGRKQN